MHKALKGIAIVVGMLALAACGSQDTLSGSTSGTSGGSSTGGSTTSTTVLIGSGSGSSFQGGVLKIDVTSLSAGGSTTVTANLVTGTGAPYTSSTDVTFVSQCVADGLATITSPVTTTTGTAKATYVAKGCSGSDTITASATVPSGTITATGTLTVQPAAVGSIAFVSADPTTIALKGTGGAGTSETSTVIFVVRDTSGGVVPGKTINFTLNTSVGGITLSPSSGTTDANGQVQTIVRAGTVHTTVRVTATVAGTSPVIATQSDQLVVSTGLPDEDSFSIAAKTLNVESYDINNVTDEITVNAADRFNNPVPDGTAIAFTTESGQIQGDCTTVDGSCSVTWTSADPRPADGRATILAYAIGEESFQDNNGDGVFDDGDTFTDIGEIYRDDNESGAYEPGSDGFFYDFNNNNVHDAADGKYEGLLCKDSTRCGTSSTLGVGKSIVIVMSGSAPVISPATSDNVTINVSAGAQTIIFTVTDARGQPLAAGTAITVKTGNGSLITPATYTVPNTNAGGINTTSFAVTVGPDGTPSTDYLTFTVTSPSGTTNSSIVTVTD